jgi:ribosomal protein S18 acetylase RimI-like enzyme
MDDDDPLSGWGLRPVELADQPTITPFFSSLAEPLSDFTFSQLYSWRNSLRILWTTLHGHLCVFANGSGDLTLLMPPIGDTNTDRALKAAFEMMDDYNVAHGVPERSRVEYASEELLARIDRTGLTLQPMGADYVYDIHRMIDLQGGDLASKRQAKNRFLRNYRHIVEPYEPAKHLDECLRLLDTWKIHQDANHLEEANTNAIKRQKESIATELTLRCANELGMKGIVVRVESAMPDVQNAIDSAQNATGGPTNTGAGDTSSPDQWPIRAFTFGELLGRDQSSITIEKTDLEVKGLAQFIFSDFCRTHWAERPLVNVGDDWGLETLAWTKMSYRPVKLLQKYALRKAAAVRVAIPAAEKFPAEKSPAVANLARAEKFPSENLSAAELATPGAALSSLSPVPAIAQIATHIVRPAVRDDLAAAVELERICFSDYSLNKRQLQYLQQRSSAVFLVAEQNGTVVGEGIALVRQHKRGLSGRIYSLAVQPDRRGQKIGLSLLEAMIEELCSRGVKRVYLKVEQHNTAAIRLYERNGFRQIGVLPDYYGSGKSANHMMREIPLLPGLFERPPILVAATAS